MSEVVPIVPDQLTPLLSDEVLAVHERWQSIGLDDIKKSMPEPVETEHGRAVILDPAGDRNENSTVVLALPHQQGWKPSMAIRAKYLQDVAAPDSRVVVLPNNTLGDRYYHLTEQQREMVSAGVLMPYFENRVRMLEALDVQGEIHLTGYSLGALTAAGLAHRASDNWQVRTLNADEAPNDIRTRKQLRHDFMHSGGWGDQRQAIKDAALPALDQALNVARLAADYARFGVATRIPENAALEDGMTASSFNTLTQLASSQNPDAAIKIGRVTASLLFNEHRFDQLKDGIQAQWVTPQFETYSGDGAHMHATGDNAVAHALMFMQARQMRAA